MAWKKDITIIVRVLINDLVSPYAFADARLEQAIVVGAHFVLTDFSLFKDYVINILKPEITPDPTEATTKDDIFINCVALKSACIIDQSIFRTKAALEGVKAAMGPANLSIKGNLEGFKILLDQGPCALYKSFLQDFEIANATNISAVLGPFVGNKFDPYMLPYNKDRDRSLFS